MKSQSGSLLRNIEKRSGDRNSAKFRMGIMHKERASAGNADAFSLSGQRGQNGQNALSENKT